MLAKFGSRVVGIEVWGDKYDESCEKYSPGNGEILALHSIYILACFFLLLSSKVRKM